MASGFRFMLIDGPRGTACARAQELSRVLHHCNGVEGGACCCLTALQQLRVSSTKSWHGNILPIYNKRSLKKK